jgi:hypothetical protein
MYLCKEMNLATLIRTQMKMAVNYPKTSSENLMIVSFNSVVGGGSGSGGVGGHLAEHWEMARVRLKLLHLSRLMRKCPLAPHSLMMCQQIMMGE